jgi:hypothetical protein
MTADVLYPLSADVTALQFMLEHEEEYRKHWRSCAQKMHTLKQRMRNPSLDLYRRVEAASDLLNLERHLETLGALTGPVSLPQDPPAIIYRIPDLDPTLVLYNRATRHLKPRPPLEPHSGWVWVLADDHPLRIAAGIPPCPLPQETSQ